MTHLRGTIVGKKYCKKPWKTNDDDHLFNQKGSSTIRESVRSPIHLFSYFDLHNVKSSVAKNKNTTKPLLASPNNAILVNNSHDYNLNADYSYSPAVSLNEELNNNILHQSICKSQLQQNNQSKSIYIPANNTNKINDKILIKLHQKSSSGKLNTSRKIEQVTPDHLAVAATQHLRSPLSSTPTLLSTSKTTMHAAASSTSDDISIINTADSKKVSSRKVNTNDNSHSNKIFSATICNPHHPVSSSDNSSSQQQSYQNCCISAKHAQMLGNLVEKDIKQFRRSIESQQNELQRIQQACLNRDRRKVGIPVFYLAFNAYKYM
ncbi:hypothetical protein GJ496_010419 [Pomphorhynchus laevis]|nr:hypothetical protein GJ496_010419 [Pomphorhynchus laevis]